MTTTARPASGEAYLDLVRRHPLVPIRSEDELAAAVAMLHSLAGRRDADASDYRATLALLVERYEDRAHPIPDAAPTDVLRHLIEAKGVNQAQVAAETGLSPSTLSEILAGKPEISRAALADYFGVGRGAFA